MKTTLLLIVFALSAIAQPAQPVTVTFDLSARQLAAVDAEAARRGKTRDQYLQGGVRLVVSNAVYNARSQTNATLIQKFEAATPAKQQAAIDCLK